MINCKQASQLISQSLDRKLAFKERLALRIHLFICEYCAKFNRQLNILRNALKRLNASVENDTSILLPSETKARIAELITTKD